MIQWRANFRPYFGLTPYDNVGSFEFYLSYAVKNELAITLDTRYLHPTEFVSDKISAVIPYLSYAESKKRNFKRKR